MSRGPSAKPVKIGRGDVSDRKVAKRHFATVGGRKRVETRWVVKTVGRR